MKGISLLFFTPIIFLFLNANAQTAASSTSTNGITIYDNNGNTPIPSSALFEVRTSTKGMLPPRLTTAQINAISSPVQGLMAYDTNLNCMKLYDGSTWNCLNSNANIGTTPLSSSFAFGPTGNNHNEGYGIAVDASNNIYVAGNFSNTITFGINNPVTITSAGGKDVYLVKYSSMGELVWVNQIGGTSEQEAIGLVVDASNNIYISGNLKSTTTFVGTSNTQTYNGNSNEKSYVAKYSSAGALVWYSVSTNSSSSCTATSLEIDATGNLYLIGQFYGNVNFGATNLISDHNSYDVFISKLNSSTGDFIWAIKAGGEEAESPTDIAVDGSGNVYIIGTYVGTTTIGTTSYTSRGYSDIFVAKYNTNGVFLWAKTAGTTNTDTGDCIAVNSAGTSIYFLGTFTGTFVFGSGLGTNPIVPSSSNYNMLLAKFDTNGNYGWATYCGNSGAYSQALDILVDPSGNNFYFTGQFSNTAIFRSINTPATFQLTSCSNSEPFIAKYSSAGVLQWAIAATGGGNDFGSRLTLRSNAIYVTGSYNYTVSFGYQQLEATGSYTNTFVWRYSEQ